jgi:hypothetical protein
MRHACLAALAAISTLLVTAPAMAGTYRVTANTDEPSAFCQPSNTPGESVCGSLRAAVETASLSPDSIDIVLLPAGTYQLSLGTLEFEGDVVLRGAGARDTEIVGDGSNTTLYVSADSTSTIEGVTLRGGVAPLSNGGNIYNSGDLTLERVRVTEGTAFAGGGIASTGKLTIAQSLIDENSADTGDGRGGGILADASTAELVVTDSTIAGNTAYSGGGIWIGSEESTRLVLRHVTLAGNDPGGALYLSYEIDSSVAASILRGVEQDDDNCPGFAPDDGGFNIDSGSGCNFTAATSLKTTNALLSASLQDLGGPTNVFSIPANSPAVDLVKPCQSTHDQRGQARAAAACDAGAYEYVAPTPTPTPTPTPPPPPAPTPTPTATPEPGRTVSVAPVRGTVRVRLPGSRQFVRLDGAAVQRVGAEYDARKGVIEITAVPRRGAKPEVARFYDGIFRLTQPGGITTLTLTEKLAPCPKGKAKRASAAAKRPKKRRLWGDGKGRFRTKGRYAAATVRGTKWLVEDSCTGTLTKVAKGSVTVRDLVRKKNIIVKKGKRYLARPPR